MKVYTAEHLTDADIEKLRGEYAAPFHRSRRVDRLITTCDVARLPSSGHMRRAAARERIAKILNESKRGS